MTDTENKLSKNGGFILTGKKGTPVYSDPRFLTQSSYARVAGRAIRGSVNNSASVTGGYFGFFTNSGGGALHGNQIQSIRSAELAGSIVVDTNVTFGVLYDTFSILLSAGCMHFARLHGNQNPYKLLWVELVTTTSPLYCGFVNNDRVANFSNIVVVDLPYPFNMDYAIATQRLAGARSNNDAFIHEKDCLIGYTITTLPQAGGAINLWFRKQDNNNLWVVGVGNTGNVTLYEYANSVLTSRGTASAAIANGQRIVVIADGSTIRVYCNNSLKITYSSATNFITCTAGQINITTGGAVSDLVTWPRYLSGAAQTVLNRYG